MSNSFRDSGNNVKGILWPFKATSSENPSERMLLGLVCLVVPQVQAESRVEALAILKT